MSKNEEDDDDMILHINTSTGTAIYTTDRITHEPLIDEEDSREIAEIVFDLYCQGHRISRIAMEPCVHVSPRTLYVWIKRQCDMNAKKWDEVKFRHICNRKHRKEQTKI